MSNERGFGFVKSEDYDEDFFIPKDKVNGAFNGDLVEILLLPKQGGKRLEAMVVKVAERAVKSVVGVYQKGKNKGYGFVCTDDKNLPDVFVDSDDSKKAKNGDKVVCNITFYGGKGKKPEGKVVEILGKENDPGMDVLSLMKSMGIPDHFEQKVLKEADCFEQKVPSEETGNRIDLRNELLVTIDGEDAKDLDDAVSLKKDGNNYILGVHIADVSHYVKEKSHLDKEAFKRGTSYYLVDRVVPMLPVQLSNGICSLNAGEDRLSMSCIMTVDKEGNVVNSLIKESVIRVKTRMNYSSVLRIISGDEKEQALFTEETPMLLMMKELSLILRNKRIQRGAIDFDIPESKITLDKKGRPVEIKPYEANDATRLIEEFMLLANETVASYMYWQELPFLYRIHETPDREKIETLSVYMKNFDYYFKGDKGEIHPAEIQKMLNAFKGRDEEGLILRLALRSMKQARYSTDCSGHFGLSCKQYTHFTSPIRRYPDLIVHRILKEELKGKLDTERINHYNGILDKIAENSSKMERRAVTAEREVDKMKKAQYMVKRIGLSYEGIISGVTGYGIYVELPSTVEGLVHISRLRGDYYEYDEDSMCITGKHTGKVFRIGQRVNVIVDDVDTKLNTIDFDLEY